MPKILLSESQSNAGKQKSIKNENQDATNHEALTRKVVAKGATKVIFY